MFKENTNKIRIITDVDMLLMVEKGLRAGICHVIHKYSKTNNKCMKNYDKKRIIIYLVFIWKQFVWMSDVSKH